MNVPTLTADPSALWNIAEFIFKHESTLTEYGALKIQMTPDCALASKKRKPSEFQKTTQKCERVHNNTPIYTVKSHRLNNYTGLRWQRSAIDEHQFWSSISRSNSDLNQPDVSELHDKSLFYDRLHRKYFSLHHVPRQSLLQLLNNNSSKFLPKLFLAHGPGAIFPLAPCQYGLSSLVFHHGGGDRYWYIIPPSERNNLQKLVDQNSSSHCLHHGKLLIDPSILDKHNIRYHRIIQCPTEFVVVSSGALTQSFTTHISWTESCLLGLPSWIRDGHAHAHLSLCRCQEKDKTVVENINLSIFSEIHIQQFIMVNFTSLNKTSASFFNKLATVPSNLPFEPWVTNCKPSNVSQCSQNIEPNDNDTDHRNNKCLEEELRLIEELLVDVDDPPKNLQDSTSLLLQQNKNIPNRWMEPGSMYSTPIHHRIKRHRNDGQVEKEDHLNSFKSDLITQPIEENHRQSFDRNHFESTESWRSTDEFLQDSQSDFPDESRATDLHTPFVVDPLTVWELESNRRKMLRRSTETSSSDTNERMANLIEYTQEYPSLF